MFLNAGPKNWRMRADCLSGGAKGLGGWGEFFSCKCKVLGDGINYILKGRKRVLKGMERFRGGGKGLGDEVKVLAFSVDR